MSGPLPMLLAPLAWPASIAYGLGVRLHALAQAAEPAWSAPRPVISVGNISAGGTGKSPMVRWICERLMESGRHPAIVMRGHRGGEASDEVLEHRAELPTVPVAVGADRRASIERLLVERPSVDAIVLDDGFQHRRVARDLDLVLVDALRPAIDGSLLPLGWLREPASGLRRASAVVVTHARGIDPRIAALVEFHHGRLPVAWSDHAWSGLRVVVGDGAAELAVEPSWLEGRSVDVWAGIGNRDAFVAQVERLGARLRAAPRLADHHAYPPDCLARLAAAGGTDVVCTGKDWAKLSGLALPSGVRVIRPVLRLEFPVDGASLRALLVDGLARGDSRCRR